MIKKLSTLEKVMSVLPLIKDTMPEDVYAHAIVTLSDSKHLEDRTLFGYYNPENKLLGCCGAYWDGRKYWVSWTAVSPEHQREGIGQQLLDKVLKFVRERGAEYIEVETYEHPDFRKAINFYWKNGFTLCGWQSNFIGGGHAGLFLRKYL